jgi:low affinity Fe/Cu permease
MHVQAPSGQRTGVTVTRSDDVPRSRQRRESGDAAPSSGQPQSPRLPSDVTPRLGVFDRFAGAAASWASRAPFFAFSVLLVVLWLIEGAVRMAGTGKANAFLDQTYQLQINTLTTIVTFLLVALLQNTQTRADAAVQHKLNAIAEGLADFMARSAERSGDEQLHRDLLELRAAVGLEEREGTSEE